MKEKKIIIKKIPEMIAFDAEVVSQLPKKQILAVSLQNTKNQL